MSSLILASRIDTRRHPAAGALRPRIVVGLCCLVVLVGVSKAADAQVTFEVVHAFTGGMEDGDTPRGPLIQAADGHFYGTTSYGGGAPGCDNGPHSGCGTIFRMTPDGVVTVLHAFTREVRGSSALIQATDGNFYGTTYSGGDTECSPQGCGTAFQMTPDGAVTVLHAFAGGVDGRNPRAPLIQATDGTFYGTTEYGGSTCFGGSGCGTVFQMTTDGTVTVVHAFAGTSDGARPYAAVLEAADGNFYGTTVNGGGTTCGGPGCGTVFQLTPAGTLTVLWRFNLGGGHDGIFPWGALIQGDDGNIYGTNWGDVVNFGTVFCVTPDLHYRLVYEFRTYAYSSSRDALLQGTDGALYGTSSNYNSAGLIFRLTVE